MHWGFDLWTLLPSVAKCVCGEHAAAGTSGHAQLRTGQGGFCALPASEWVRNARV